MNHNTAAGSGEGSAPASFLSSDWIEQLGRDDGPIPINSLASENIPESGEVRLMRAVLRDALKCFQKYSVGPGRNTRRARIELQAVQRWFADDAGDHALAFANVCAMLGLDPRVIRSALDAWQKKHGKQRIHANRMRRSSKNGRGQPVVEGRS